MLTTDNCRKRMNSEHIQLSTGRQLVIVLCLGKDYIMGRESSNIYEVVSSTIDAQGNVTNVTRPTKYPDGKPRRKKKKASSLAEVTPFGIATRAVKPAFLPSATQTADWARKYVTPPPANDPFGVSRPNPNQVAIPGAGKGVVGKVIQKGVAVAAAANEIDKALDRKPSEVATKIAKGIKAKMDKQLANSTSKSTTSKSTTTSTTTTSSKGGSTTINAYSGGNSYLMVCDKPNNKKINLNTGVRSGLIVNDGEPFNPTDFSPLYMMGGDLLRKDFIDTSFKEYVSTIIYPTIASKVQFTLNYAYELSLEDFESWFYKITECLQLYYTLDSIIVYCDDRDNTNQGLRHLRTLITSDMRLKLNLLRDLIGKQPIPPNVLQYIRYMCQNYKFSELPGSPIYRLFPGNLFNPNASVGGVNADSYTNRLSATIISNLIADLGRLSPIHNKIYQAVPEWHVPNSCLPPSCITPYYDEGFRTFWFNSSCTYLITSTGLTGFTRSSTTGFRYWLYTNVYDGVFFASASFNKTGEAETRPGLYNPTTDFSTITGNSYKSNTLYYYKVNNVEKMANIDQTQLALQFDCITVPIYNTSTSAFNTIPNLDGSTQVAQECTFETWKQAVYMVTVWLFN